MITDIIKISWKLAISHKLAIIRANLLFFAVLFFYEYLAALVAMRLSYYREMQNGLLALFSLPLLVWIVPNVVNFYHTLAKGSALSITALIHFPRRFFSLMIYFLIQFSIIFFFLYSFQRFFYIHPLYQIQGIVCFLMALYFGLRTIFTPFLIVLNSSHFYSAMIASWDITSSQKLNTLKMCGWLIIFTIMGGLLFGLGILFFFGLAMVFFVNVFLYIDKNNKNNV